MVVQGELVVEEFKLINRTWPLFDSLVYVHFPDHRLMGTVGQGLATT
jgi:hypothetical protein